MTGATLAGTIAGRRQDPLGDATHFMRTDILGDRRKKGLPRLLSKTAPLSLIRLRDRLRVYGYLLIGQDKMLFATAAGIRSQWFSRLGRGVAFRQVLPRCHVSALPTICDHVATVRVTIFGSCLAPRANGDSFA